MSNTKRIPELRFPEFKNDGEWVETTLNEVANYENGKAHEKEISANGKYKVVNSKFISTDGVVVKFTDSANLKANIGDILMVLSDIPNGKAIAKCFYVDKENTYTVNQRICKITPKIIDNKFLFYIQNRNRYFLTFDDGVKQTNLRKDTVLAFPFQKPQDLHEQQKIASCLSSLDELIAAHNEKLDALKSHKKGLMQNLFPNSLNHDFKGLKDDHDLKTGKKSSNQVNQKNQGSNNVPNYRFPEFENDGEWVETILGKCILNKPEYGLNSAAVPYSEKLPTYLRITDISEEGNFLAETKVSVDREVTKQDHLEEGDVVFARTGASVGKSYRYRIKDGKLVFAGFLIRVKPNPDLLDSELLFQFVSTSMYWSWVRAVSVRSGQPGINGTQYSNMPLTLPPTIAEQQKIASCLSSLDELITAQTKKIEQLQQHKKGLMQGLFPNSLNYDSKRLKDDPDFENTKK